MKCEWSLLASKQSYYHLHLLFYQLPLRQITLSSHNHDDQSRLWAALSSGRTRSFSLTWRLPQESHQTSQVMLHWSEKCKTYTKDWDWEWTHFWDTFVAKFGIYTEWGGSFTFGIKQEDKTASTNHPESAQVAPTPTTVFLSPSLLEICLSWRQFVLLPWTMSQRSQNNSAHMDPGSQYSIWHPEIFREKRRHRSEREAQTSCKKCTNKCCNRSKVQSINIFYIFRSNHQYCKA